MNRIKNWITRSAIGIAALFGAHTIQPVQVENGLPSQVSQPISISPIPQKLGIPRIAAGSISCNDSERVMILRGFEYVNQVLASDEFRGYVIGAKFTENQDYSGQALYDKLASKLITLNVVMFTGSFYQNYGSKTVGYENEPGTVYMNRHFVNSAYMVADNLIHEGEGHSQEFMHLGVKSTSEPYGMNLGFKNIAPMVGIKE